MHRTAKFFTLRTMIPLSLGVAGGAGLALAVLASGPVSMEAQAAPAPAGKSVETIKPLSSAPGIRLVRIHSGDGSRCFAMSGKAGAGTICAH
ncbi:MAG: hypothetical protein FJX29_02890 [Alphaproteobacteria bacterium]|nr:hypothetical protein [Alphaproteobacteria bacterium]